VRNSDQTSGTARTRPRGRRRQPATDRSILEATIGLLGDAGLEGATTANIARRSGFAKTTIYRRWPTRDALLLDAFRLTVEASVARLAASGPAGPAGRSGVHAVSLHAQHVFDGPVFAAVLPIIARHTLAETELGRRFRTAVLDPMRAASRARLMATMARDEIRAEVDLDIVVDLAYGGLLFRALTGGQRDETASASMADILLTGAATSAPV
jgi:AcrR family transcriptional regulator